jgi:hypothetical protein
MSFFENKNRTGRQNSPLCGVSTSGREEDIRKGDRRGSRVEIFCTHVCK